MIFLRRPGVIHVDCFTDRLDVIKYNKIDHAMKFIPEWWKELPKEDPTKLHPFASMKSCQGFIDLFRRGIVLPLWTDLSILLGKQGTQDIQWQFADLASIAALHDSGQRGDYLPATKYQHLKIDSPWFFKTKEDLHWVVHRPTWLSNDPSAIIFPQGIVNFKWQISTTVNVFLERKKEQQKFLLEAGQPMHQFIPMSEKKIVLHHHLVEQKDMSRILEGALLRKFRNGYNVGKKIQQEQASKCPFGFK